MFLTRVLTAAALLAAFLAALLWLDRAAFAAVVAAIVALAGYEWARLAGLAQAWAAGYAVLCAALFAILPGDIPLAPVLWGAALFWIIAVPWWLAAGVSSKDRAWLLAAGPGVLLPAAWAMAAMPPRLLLITLGLVWIADTAAYLAGRAFGRRRLATTISPGKTWEGVAAGVVGCVIYAIICAMLNPDLGARIQGAIWVPYLAGATLLCAAGIVGDLFESALKRQAGAKDSGTLLPGHGGVLDRIDSATAVLPLGLLVLQAMGAL